MGSAVTEKLTVSISTFQHCHDLEIKSRSLWQNLWHVTVHLICDCPFLHCSGRFECTVFHGISGIICVCVCVCVCVLYGQFLCVLRGQFCVYCVVSGERSSLAWEGDCPLSPSKPALTAVEFMSNKWWDAATLFWLLEIRDQGLLGCVVVYTYAEHYVQRFTATPCSEKLVTTHNVSLRIREDLSPRCRTSKLDR